MAAWNEMFPSRTELHDAKRGALLREAAAAFNRQGFHATSLEEIAGRLGVSKAALYHYFPNKQVLLRECFDTAMEVAFASYEEAKLQGRNGREKLILTLSSYLAKMIDETSWIIVPLEDTALLRPIATNWSAYEIGSSGRCETSSAKGSPMAASCLAIPSLSSLPFWARSIGCRSGFARMVPGRPRKLRAR